MQARVPVPPLGIQFDAVGIMETSRFPQRDGASQHWDWVDFPLLEQFHFQSGKK